MAHAITDGLTPAHHYPLGEKIEEYHIPKLLTEEEMEGLHLATEDRSAR